MADAPPHALEVTPESSLQFTLTRTPAEGGGGANDPTAKCTMTLRHTGKTGEHLAFKVKTTQPRRYLVRPNQGVVAPNTTETVSILLVERDKQILLHSYDRLGQSALDHSKDKFLVQSCVVTSDFATRYMSEKAKSSSKPDAKGAGGAISGLSKEMADQLTAMWNSVASVGAVPIYNKKLHVRHVVPPGESSAGGGAGGSTAPAAATARGAQPALTTSEKTPTENMSAEQMFAEIASLRRKYDELVSFSVNLTAERDILNNTLEQTKRDLNREMAARAALENSQGGKGRSAGGAAQGSKSGGMSMVVVLLVAIVCAFGGIKAANMGAVEFLGNVPVLGPLLEIGDASEPLVEAASDTPSDEL